MEDRQHLGGLPFCPNVQYSLLAKTICFCPFWFLYQEKLLKLSHMQNHSLTLRLFLLPSRLLCSLVRGGTCPLGPYRLIAYGYVTTYSKLATRFCGVKMLNRKQTNWKGSLIVYRGGGGIKFCYLIFGTNPTLFGIPFHSQKSNSAC